MDRVEIIAIIYNFLDMLNGQEVKFFEQPVNFYCRKGVQAFLSKAKNVAREINSSKFTTDQFIKFLFITALLKGQKGIYQFQVKDIIKVRRITERFAIKDEEIVNKICQKYRVPVDDLFEIRDNGESILYKLLKTNHISMAYALKNYKNVLTIAEKNVILFKTEYSFFHVLFKKFISYLQGVSYAKI
jgi:hypothetical protein